MSGLPESVRSAPTPWTLGNTTAATGKGFAIGSAALTALALLVSYVNIVAEKSEAALDLSPSPTPDAGGAVPGGHAYLRVFLP